MSDVWPGVGHVSGRMNSALQISWIGAAYTLGFQTGVVSVLENRSMLSLTCSDEGEGRRVPASGARLTRHAEGARGDRGGFCVGSLEHFLEVLDFRAGIAEQVLREAVGQRLMNQFGHYLVAGAAEPCNPVADLIAAADKVIISQRIAGDADVRRGGRLVEALRQDAVVLQIGHAAQQRVGDLVHVIAHDRFVDLHLIR
jgi:hypothetical protein